MTNNGAAVTNCKQMDMTQTNGFAAMRAEFIDAASDTQRSQRTKKKTKNTPTPLSFTVSRHKARERLVLRYKRHVCHSSQSAVYIAVDEDDVVVVVRRLPGHRVHYSAVSTDLC